MVFNPVSARVATTFFLIAIAVAVVATPAASAHGKEVSIEVVPLSPQAEQPLTRLYLAQVVFDDGDLVEDAVMELVAVREEDGSSVGPVEFQALQPGRYVAEIDYERFGNWVITVSVSEPGSGEAGFVDAVLPGENAGSVEGSTTPTSSQELSVIFDFDGSDVSSILVRLGHVLGAAVWVGLLAIPAVAFWASSPEARRKTLLRIQPFFMPLAAVSLFLILVSGIHSAVYGTPIRSPGIFDLDTMFAVPFGEAYFVALLIMILAWPLMAGLSWRLDRGLRTLSLNGDDVVAEAAVRSSSLAGLAVAAFVAVDITILLYLHNISHLSLVVPR